ncbi:MAG: hypothetical protein ACXVW2_12500 [Nocardioidaceae bacterium]
MNISTARRALIVLVTLGFSPLLAAAPAAAESLSYTDTTQDFWQLNTASSTESYTAAPDLTNGDVSRVTGRYARQLVIRENYVDLARETGTTFLAGYVRTNEGVRRGFEVKIRPTSWAGTMQVTNRNDQPISCAGATHHVDYTANTLRVTIPASCLSKPRWVQLQVGSVLMRHHQSDIYLDDAQSPGHGFRKWSARIHRG